MSEFKQRALTYHQALRQLLMLEWDPIGVKGIAEAQDEYDSYIPKIYQLLIERRPRHELFDYLWWAVTENMGLCGNRRETERVVDLLFILPEQLQASLPRAGGDP